MKSKILSWLAILLILEIGLLHIMTAQAEYEEAAYMGYLFAVNFFGSLLAAYAIYRRQFGGWVLGLVIAAGSIAGYIYSRTLGMPGMNVEEWFSPYGVVSLTVEVAYILIFLLRPWKLQADGSASGDNAWIRYGLAAFGGLSIVMIGALAYQWDVQVKTNYGHHVGSLTKVCSTPVTSFTDLEKNYGVQVSLAATSMMGSIVDVRLRIVDPDKAHALLQNQAALLVGQQSLILAPHMHSHNSTRLKAGKTFIIFFPAQQVIKPGSQISLVFGSVRVEPVVVR
jgi:hypothetical protein